MEGFVPPELPIEPEDTEKAEDQKKPWTPRTRAITPSQQGRSTPKGFKPTYDKPMASVRCTGIVKNGVRKGEQCDKWATPLGSIVCLSHGGHLPNVKKAAERRVQEMRTYIIGEADRAVDTLFDLMEGDYGEQVRLGAAKEILAIAGVKDKETIQVEVEHRRAGSEIISERLAQLATTKPAEEEDVLIDEGEVIDGEVEEDETT